MKKTVATTIVTPREVALDDVRAALRGGHEAHSGHARVAPGVHQDEPDQGDGDDEVEEDENRQHLRGRG